MPERIVTIDGKTFQIRPFELPVPGPHEVRVRVEFAAPKHGTEGHALGGSAFDSRQWDPELRMFVPRTEPAAPPAERGVGNIVVGSVIALGGEVTRWAVGDRVFGYGGIRTEHQAPEEHWRSMDGLSDVDAVCTDPAHVAFVAVRDGNVRIGDTVAVLGLGAIGLLAIQVARAGGARQVFAVDPVSKRRTHAETHGADRALDPTSSDPALEIKRATGGKGVDVSIETSGSAKALHEAIRCIRQCGTVVHVPWGPKSCADLHLDEEFHLNRPTLVGSQAWPGWGNPDRDHPLWDFERAYRAAIDLFRDGLITGEGIVTPIVHFADTPQLLTAAFASPESAIKVGVRF
jgi:threonine dehydrogenase-like Zn-dependent dehydrogenase